jgi:hypothetical protein
MLNLTAYVIEFEKNNRYKVIIGDVWRGFISDNGLEDDSTLSFRGALEGIVEVLLSNDYNIEMVKKGYSKKGRPCRKYTVSIDDGD